MRFSQLLLCLVSLLLTSGCFRRTRIPIQTGPPAMQVLGDSLSEGVQSADANRATQPCGYASLIALQMRGSFPLPLIDVSPVGVVGSTFLRGRMHPAVISADLGVSGATVSDTLATKAQPSAENEYELVLSPRATTEIGAAEQNPAPLILFWAGNNDVIPAVLSFDQLNGSQITPPDIFQANITQAMTRLKALGHPVVVGNIPDVTRIAFVMDRATLQQFAGSDFGLPEGSYTTVITAELLRLGFDDASILQDPNYVLDATEIERIRAAVKNMNSIIASAAADAGFPVVDVYDLYERLRMHPPVYAGVTLTSRYLGGLFSLDGIHPSDISYALLANHFIQAIDSRYASGAAPSLAPIAPLTEKQLNKIARQDPFVDHKNDGQVSGRFGAGLLETLAPFLGIKHDERPPRAPGAPARKVSPPSKEKFIAEYRKRAQSSKPANAPATRKEAEDAMRHIFGLNAANAQ